MTSSCASMILHSGGGGVIWGRDGSRNVASYSACCNILYLTSNRIFHASSSHLLLASTTLASVALSWASAMSLQISALVSRSLL